MPSLKRLYLLFFILFIIILAILSTFWISGNIFHHRYVALIKELNEKTSSKLTIVSYNQGWFRSSAQLTIPIIENSPPIIMEQIISHGPWVYDSIHNEHVIALGAIQSSASMKGFFNKSEKYELMTINSLFRWNNQYISQIKILPFDVSLGTNSIKWAGLTTDIKMTREKDHVLRLAMNTLVTPLTIILRDFSYTQSDIETKMDIELGSTGMWYGTQMISMPQADMTIENNKYSITGFNHTSHLLTKIPNEDSYDFTLTIQQVITPYINFNPLQTQLSITGINENALKKLMSQPNNIDQTDFINLLTANTIVNFNILNNSNFGNLELKGKIDWPPNTLLPTTVEELENHIRSHVEIKLPVALVNYFLAMSIEKTKSNAESVDPSKASLISVEKKLEELQDNNVISTSTKIGILNLLETHPKSDVFSHYLDQLTTMNSIPVDVATSIKDEFQQIEKNTSSPVMSSPVIDPPTTQDLLDERINAYKTMGLIIQNNDQYITIIDFENGEFSFNGKQIPINELMSH
jgi:uncharacterized protein YdgA (DUF945 family)